MQQDMIVILDLGSEQNAQLAREIRALGVYSEIHPHDITAAELKALPGDFTPSEFVAKVTGVDNVCERAALMGAEKLILHKTAVNGVTVALAAEKTEVRFV